MKKKKIAIVIIAILLMSGFVLTGCREPLENPKKISGTVTADTNGTILFMYSRTNANHPDFCTFTTDLPAPNDQFIITILSGETSGNKEIEGLLAGQKVSWTATVEGKPLNHGSNNFVHVVND